MRGKLIVFEGIEGSGKTTQIHHLRQWLDHKLSNGELPNYPTGVIVTRQPGGTSIGQHIRQVLLKPSQGPESLTSTSELLLYAADRAQHVERILIPALETGHLVLCDRYTDSTVAYQGYGRQLDLSLIDTLNTIATGGLSSDLTLWLKLDVTAGLERITTRGDTDRIEQAGIEFHRRVHKGFTAQAKVHGEKFIAVDASPAPETVAQHVQTIVSAYLQQWYAL
ncbi:thymidylate kinase [Leptolyngbya sp. Heron Island J]|uniref:dTMP kinase n=1 Tax=Leptolyngbya sp. Heron Island J TaxID=1385935 RepID=UPI0003B9AE8C|nr:dTMP kinase [Leptolyngbya sp. Heron Island J]ESA34231.1 thymidylate kinase [Leptolyngbya sp. Heron Island J]